MIRILTFSLVLLFVYQAKAFDEPSFDISGFREDVTFLGVVEITSAEARPAKDANGYICGVSYEAKVIEPIYGKSDSKNVDLHMLLDPRMGYLFGDVIRFLEVGSRYIIYAESRSTHRLVSLTDVLRRAPDYDEGCYSSSASTHYIYPEFTSKVELFQDGDHSSETHLVVRGNGYRNIAGTDELRRIWFNEKSIEFSVATLSWLEAAKKNLTLQGLLLDDLVRFMRNGLNKSKHTEADKSASGV